MYIQPNSDLYLLNNVPLDDTYEHTLYFDSSSAQTSYFIGRRKYSLTGQSYQRVNKGVARVGILADNLYDVNYIMFRNTAFGAKWFYAFVTKVEYVNNNCTDVYYEMDVLQTWHFDYSLDMCYVLRQHTISDVPLTYLAPEPINIGEYVFNNYEPAFIMTTMCVVIGIVDTSGTTSGNQYDGIYGGAELWAYYASETDEINSKVNEYVQKPDAIICMYMIPEVLLGSVPADHKIKSSTKAVTQTRELPKINGTESLDGYVPRNKKLYSYPFNFIHLDNANGGDLSLRYEFFRFGVPAIQISGGITQPVKVLLRPYNYKGSWLGNTEQTPTLNTESLVLENYPLCSWNIDAYQAWVSQNMFSIGMEGARTAGSVLGSLLNFDIGGAVSTALNGATNLMEQQYSASIQADIMKGNMTSGNVNVANLKQQFYWGRCSVNKSDAKRIDAFFDRFGYAIGENVIPNRSARPHWNYVKTAGCTVTGSVPADDMRKICGIYDAGVTWWKKASEIGNYSLDNSP